MDYRIGRLNKYATQYYSILNTLGDRTDQENRVNFTLEL